MRPSVRISQANRDRLARIASEELDGGTLDDALGVLLFEHETRRTVARPVVDRPPAE